MNVSNISQSDYTVNLSSVKSNAGQERVADSAKQMGELLKDVQKKSADLAEKMTKLAVSVDLYA